MTATNTRAQLNKASALIKNNQKSQAITLLKPILAQEPSNAGAWWLAVHASPTPDAAIEACRRLMLPDSPDDRASCPQLAVEHLCG